MTGEPTTRRGKAASGCRRVATVVAVSLVLGCTGSRAPQTPPADSAATAGGTLVVGITEPASVDPAHAADRSAALVVGTMCDPLIQSDPVTGALTPAIAESWQVSDAGRRFTVKLREGVRFHNGQELTAEDVVFSLSRVASDETASALAALLRPVQGYQQVHGEEEVDEERLRETLRGLRVIEDYSFELALDDPLADFVRLLTHPLASPVSREAAESDPAGFARRPVCAGPYRMAEPWDHGDETIRLKRFEGYQAVNEGYTRAGRGYADEIRFRVLPEPATQLAEFRAGAVDTARVPRSAINGGETVGGSVVQAAGPRLEYVGLPTEVPPFDDPVVRRALSQALDRDVIAATVFAGAAVAATGFLPPTLGPVYRDAACGPAAPASGDVAGARTALAEAGVDLDGMRVELAFNDEFGHAALVAAVAAQWQAAFGLEVAPVAMTWQAHLAAAQERSGYDHPFRLSWAAEYPSADRYLAPLFHSDNIGRTNLTRFDNAEFDRFLERVARRATDADERRLDYQQLEDLVCEQMPLVPVAFPTANHLIATQRLGSARGGTFTDVTTGDLLVRELYLRGEAVAVGVSTAGEPDDAHGRDIGRA